MSTTQSTNPLQSANRVVIKIGSALLVDRDSHALRRNWLTGIGEDIALLREKGTQVVVVSSGSIALGREILALPNDLTLAQAQAAASVGQIALARAYKEILEPFALNAAQLLLTLEDSQNRRRYLNSRATFATLLDLGVVPIVNENDTVATDEIRFGDNDRLAAQVAALIGADCLVLLSDVDGLYTGNPKADPNAQHIAKIDAITPQIEQMATGAGSDMASGGMQTKLLAAKTATKAGCHMLVGLGGVSRPIKALMAGARNSWFVAQSDPKTARKLWIAAMKPKGRLIIDAGAAKALAQGKSLLPAGVTEVEGSFDRGDCIEIADIAGGLKVKALASYSGTEARKIVGSNSAEIEKILGYSRGAVLAHRDDMEG